MVDSEVFSFSSAYPIQVLIRPASGDPLSWKELDIGPGYFRIEPGMEVGVRIHSSNDETLREIVQEFQACHSLTHLDLSENRKISDTGIEYLHHLNTLKELNLSSCDITNDVFSTLKIFSNLEILNLSFCPRISDSGLKSVRDLRNLVFLDLQGCPRITRAGLAWIERAGLAIHKH
jgi:hypothetical protein